MDLDVSNLLRYVVDEPGIFVVTGIKRSGVFDRLEHGITDGLALRGVSNRAGIAATHGCAPLTDHCAVREVGLGECVRAGHQLPYDKRNNRQ